MQQESDRKAAKLPKVELGGNSLLIIALIVGVCSGSEHRGQNETQKEMEQLRQTVERLEKKVDQINTRLPPAVTTDVEKKPKDR